MHRQPLTTALPSLGAISAMSSGTTNVGPSPGTGGAGLNLALGHPAIDAVLSTAATLLGMEVVFIGGLSDSRFTLEAMCQGRDWPDVPTGQSAPRADSFCHRLLEGAPTSTADAENDPHYRDVPARERFGIRSYVGVPVRNRAGQVVATLCGIDRRSVAVDEATYGVLQELAEIVTAHLEPLAPPAEQPSHGIAAPELLIRRSATGWQVDVAGRSEPTEDLTSAMVLADLLAGEFAPGPRPAKPEVPPRDEVSRLRLSVRQLEHALAARVVVEQAIGVLTERHATSPRESFERLRRVARSGGRRVHDLAGEVVASATNRGAVLPAELTRRGGR